MIRIDELHIRARGQNEEEGKELGRQISERLAEAIPEPGADIRIPEIRVRVQSTSPGDPAQSIDRITEQIIRQINLEAF